MRPHILLFESVRQRTLTYLTEETYAAVVGFVSGYDAGCAGGLLLGFREWLVLRLGLGSNLGWPTLALHVAFPAARSVDATVLDGSNAHRHAIDTLFDLLFEFDELRSDRDGLKDLYVRYQKWEKSRGIVHPKPRLKRK
jgi:hypothetical protein